MNIELPLDGKQRNRLRPASKALFHSSFALEAFILIGQEPRFYGGQLAAVTGCQANFAGQFLKRLEDERLIERLPREEGQIRRYFQKVPSPIWGTLMALAQGLLDEPESNIAHLPKR